MEWDRVSLAGGEGVVLLLMIPVVETPHSLLFYHALHKAQLGYSLRPLVLGLCVIFCH